MKEKYPQYDIATNYLISSHISIYLDWETISTFSIHEYILFPRRRHDNTQNENIECYIKMDPDKF